MSQSTCRWAILGAAGIAKKNWQAIHNAENARLVAVGSRDIARAQEFIDQCQAQVPFAEAPQAHSGYDDILNSPDIDAVYIPLPTSLRKQWVMKAAAAGKHVLAEKPSADTADDLREMIAACERAGVQYMDGVMFMHGARLAEIQQVLREGQQIGEIRRIGSQFSFCADDTWMTNDIRLNSDLEPFGCLGDLGWYNLRFFLCAMGYEMPTSVTGRTLAEHGREDSPSKVPTEFSGEVTWRSGATASFYCSFRTGLQQWMVVSGVSGYLEVADFVLPFHGPETGFRVENTEFEIDTCRFNMASHSRQHSQHEYANNHPTAQETNLFRNFSSLALAGTPDPFWPEVALKTQILNDACIESARNGSRPVEVSM